MIDEGKYRWISVQTYGCMYMTKPHPKPLGNRAKGLVMSELHLEITELIEAGINVHNTHDTLREARARGYRLVARVIEHNPNSFLKFVASWFDEEVAA